MLSKREMEGVLQRNHEPNFNSLVGIRLVACHRDGVTIDCALRPELLNFHGVLHGGVTATLADVAVGMAISNHFRGKSKQTTVEMKINFLRPATGRKVRARSRLLKVGTKLTIGQVDLFDEEKRRIGAALVTYMLLETPAG